MGTPPLTAPSAIQTADSPPLLYRQLTDPSAIQTADRPFCYTDKRNLDLPSLNLR
ncbi:hypothetical protein [Porphyromonas crevioricanis]|uniref:hypothetical protein n=1 Tax=Porphyromonas crevioricanis TaxID=393921 RepID=UPI000A4BEA82|nr:hypothetical protein [Porphyromonas crevioricanis]